jgi:hypothetical protein
MASFSGRRQRREVSFMVFIVKPRLMPSLERSIQGKIEEVAMRVRLDANTTNDLPFGSTRLILQKGLMLEEWEVGVDGEVAFT